jgi:uncharacterized protein YegL
LEEFSDIPSVDFVENTAPRLPCIVLVDGSDSMSGNGRIDQLNEGLKQFAQDLKDDPNSRTGVRLKVIRFGGHVEDLVDWTDGKDFEAPQVRTSGLTPLGIAVNKALDDLEDEKRRMDEADIIRKRAWVFIFTDGDPTDDDWEAAADRCRALEQAGSICVYGVGVDGANTENLARFSADNPPAMLRSADFKAFFKFLAASTRAGSIGTKGETVQSSQQTPWTFKV